MEETERLLNRETLKFTEHLASEYLEKRNLQALLNRLEERTSWIGTGSDEVCWNLSQAQQALEYELSEPGSVFQITRMQCETEELRPKSCIAFGALSAEPVDPELSVENLRFTVLAEKTAEGVKLLHLHLSRPDDDQEQGQFHVFKEARSAAKTLRLELDAQNRQIEHLTQNIPGGMRQCRNDPNFTLLSMSDGFLTMFGFTREEIRERFNDCFMEMVYPGDRAAMLKSVHMQLQNGRSIELEYRVLHKAGPPVWILDKGRLLPDGEGGECFYCMLMEITERKLAQEELRLSLERHKVIMDQATDIIFEWDIRRDTLLFSSNWRKKFGYEPIDTQISGRIPISQNIHPDDMPAFVGLMRATAAGDPYSESEFRIRDSQGRFCWCRIRATAQFDSDGRPIKAVGVIADIEVEKREKQTLLDQAQRDPLTGLYNKAATDSMVESRIRGGDAHVMHALFILDVDYFKEVNDTYGHMTGDSLLSDVAVQLKSHVRATDLVGRIGGDEFLIYLPEVASEEAARTKAEELWAALGLLTPETNAAPVTCSIGAAVFRHGEVEYPTFYQCADQALYRRKNSGRNGVTLYEASRQEDDASQSLPRTGMDFDKGDVRDDQLAQYTFRTLYAARDVEATLSRLLEIVGRSNNVSRIYIFESSNDGLTNTFEWCNDGVEPRINKLQNLSLKDDLDGFRRNFDESGLFYCSDVREMSKELRAVLEPQGIHSMIQCGIFDEGEIVGCVGFDECRNYNAWTHRQAAAIKLTADVLSTFLRKQRLKQKAK